MAIRKSQIYAVNIGGSGLIDIGALKYQFRAPEDAYNDIGDILGVKKITDVDFGVGKNNRFAPVKVRISYIFRAATSDIPAIIRSTIRFCDPDKVETVTIGRKLNSKKVTVAAKAYDINNVSVIGGR